MGALINDCSYRIIVYTFRRLTLPLANTSASFWAKMRIIQNFAGSNFYFPGSTASQSLPCMQMADEIKRKIKEIGLSRQKIVAYVIVGQNKRQGAHVTSRALWDASTDNMASVSVTSDAIFVVGIVFVTYFE